MTAPSRTPEGQKKHRDAHRALGLCVVCPNKAATGRTKCERHLRLQREMKSPSKTPEAQKAWREKRKALGLCVSCKEPAVSGRVMCERHLQMVRDGNTRRYGTNTWWKGLYQELRQEAIKAYGAKCQCCGETEPKFLALDHVRGGGTKHRKEVGSGIGFLQWLKRKGYPDSIRLLCHNCHGAITNCGSCPHRDEVASSHVVA